MTRTAKQMQMRPLLFVALFGLVALSQAAPSPGVWDLFKTAHGKSYSCAAEEALRMSIFFEKVAQIDQHNARFEDGAESFKMAINKFSDMLPSEVSAKMNGFKPSDKIETTASFATLEPAAPLPDHVDWRNLGLVTPVKAMGQCAASWAFSATGSLEGQHAKKTGNLVSLSEQQIADCSNVSSPCNGGGSVDEAFQYILQAGGIMSEAGYAQDPTCKFNATRVAATLTGYVDVPKGDEEALKATVATVGPISVAIDASHGSFQAYRSGIYYDASCSSTSIDHATLVVGYGTESGRDYWLVKNNWGANWGEAGYIKMSRNRDNNCGIATMASFPTVQQEPIPEGPRI